MNKADELLRRLRTEAELHKKNGKLSDTGVTLAFEAFRELDALVSKGEEMPGDWDWAKGPPPDDYMISNILEVRDHLEMDDIPVQGFFVKGTAGVTLTSFKKGVIIRGSSAYNEPELPRHELLYPFSADTFDRTIKQADKETKR